MYLWGIICPRKTIVHSCTFYTRVSWTSQQSKSNALVVLFSQQGKALFYVKLTKSRTQKVVYIYM